jgi:MarR family transcriptional regulator, organic hydroperoxide resistance regulator
LNVDLKQFAPGNGAGQTGTKPGGDPNDLKPEQSAGYLVRDTHLLFAKTLRMRLQQHQITPGQWYFLRTLWDEEGLSQRELSRRVGTTEPTTVSALRLLARNGMIERVRNPKDRRTINIFLTDKARAMKDELMPVAVEVNDIATRGLSDEEFTQLRSLLQKVRENLSEAAN